MSTAFTSERLLREHPRPLLNFLWYLWETNYDPCETEFRITLQNDNKGQQFLIHSTGDIITQDLGCCVNAEIVVRKCCTRYFMDYC